LLLGLEPITALAVGVGAVILAPVVNAVGSALGEDSSKRESLSEAAREWTKNGLVWGFEAVENAQTIFAQAEESFKDLVSDAKVEYMMKKSNSQTVEPHQVEIVSD
jgi:hypothetical protein